MEACSNGEQIEHLKRENAVNDLMQLVSAAFGAMRAELGDEFVRSAASVMLNEQIAFAGMSAVMPLLSRLAAESSAPGSGLVREQAAAGKRLISAHCRHCRRRRPRCCDFSARVCGR